MTEPDTSIGGLMAVWVRVPSEIRAAFDRWYDEEHLPERRVFSGFVTAERFEPLDDGDNHAAFYELVAPEATESPDYLALRNKPNTGLGEIVRAGWKDQQRVLYSTVTSSTSAERPLLCPALIASRTYFRDQITGKDLAIEEKRVSRILNAPGIRSHQRFASLEGEFHLLDLWGVDDSAAVDSQRELTTEADSESVSRVITRAYRRPQSA